MTNEWIRRRWFDFRNGHSIYLIFALSFSNFILIFHRLLIEQVDFLNDIFSSLWVFAIVFILIYIPVAIVIGHWHKRTQFKVEHEVQAREAPYMARWWRILIDMQTGKASDEEVEALRKQLKSIEEGRGSTYKNSDDEITKS